MKTKCKLTKKKGQNKHTLKDLKLTVSKAMYPSELSPLLSKRCTSAQSRLCAALTRSCGALGEGLFLPFYLKMVVISGLPQGASAESALPLPTQWPAPHPPHMLVPLCHGPLPRQPLSPQQLHSYTCGSVFTFWRIFRNYTSHPVGSVCLAHTGSGTVGRPPGSHCELVPEFLLGTGPLGLGLYLQELLPLSQALGSQHPGLRSQL